MWQPCEYREWPVAAGPGDGRLCAAIWHVPYGPYEPDIPAVRVFHPVETSDSVARVAVLRQCVRERLFQLWARQWGD